MKNELTKLLPEAKENVVLASYTTYKVGGPAHYFFVAHDEEAIKKAVRAARELGIPFFILGGGSNLLVSDKGFDGLVIKIENCKLEIPSFVEAAEGKPSYAPPSPEATEGRGKVSEGKQNFIGEADAGVDMAILVSETTKRGLRGLEWAGGLPGTFGGAIRGNAGAFGGEIKDSILEVKALDFDGNINVFSKEQCGFSYRSSVFKEKGFVVLSAKIIFTRADVEELIAETQRHIHYRKERHPLEYPNAGSIFKNCDLNLFPKNEWGKFEHVVKNDPFPVVPTAFLISEAGLKGVAVGGAMVSEMHPNFIVNKNNATSSDIMELMNIVQERVQEKFGVNLEREVQFVGFGGNKM